MQIAVRGSNLLLCEQFACKLRGNLFVFTHVNAELVSASVTDPETSSG